MRLKRNARPGLPGGGRASDSVAAGNDHHDSTMQLGYAALSVFKRGRWVVAAKVVPLDGVPVLAIVHRHQHGVREVVSVPEAVLQYAEACECRWLHFRRDTSGEMFRLPLSEVRRIGYLGPGAGMEHFIPIRIMEAIPWRRWPYLQRTIQLGGTETSGSASGAADKPEPEADHLSLPGQGGDDGDQ